MVFDADIPMLKKYYTRYQKTLWIKNVRTQNLCFYKIKRFKQRCLINLQNRDQTQKEPDNNENACLASSVQD